MMRLLVAALLASGCTGSHVGNPSDLTVALTGYDEAAPGALTLSTGIAIDEAWVVLARLRLRSAENCSRRDGSIDVPAPLAAELVQPLVLPDPPVLAVEATRYCRVELQLGLDEGGTLEGTPADLDGRSVLVRGTRRDAVPFELASTRRDPFRLDAEDDPFALPEGESALLVSFAMNEWFDADALDAAEVSERDGEPFITIDDRENRALHDAFRDTLRASARLHRDIDGDGILDESDRAQLLGVGVLE
jgi:hypothetical protein